MERALYMATVMFIGGVFITCSAGLIAFNKYLMSDGRFPFPLHLVALHAGSGSCFSALLYIIKPSLFRSFQIDDARATFGPRFVLTRILPIGSLFVLYNVLSNQAYRFCSVAFLQMMKEMNVALVYSMAVMASLESYSWMKARVLLCVMGATAMTIHGELNFSAIGFMVQMSSQLFESARITLQSSILTQGAKLDPFSYNLLVLPTSFVLLVLTAAGNHVFHILPEPSINDFVQWWHVLACNALLAFALNLIVALFMSRTSAVATVLAGIVKDFTIVSCSCFLLGEPLSRLQACGFTLQLTAISVWSIVKLNPDMFQDSIVNGMYNLIIPGEDKKKFAQAVDIPYGSARA